MAPYTDLFFMGVAFLLLETKNVVQFALLFGTTWAVNAAVFAGVLLSVLAAIEVARRVRIARPVLLYPALLAALVLAWVVPGDLLLDLSPVPRFLVGVTIAFLPIFVANLIFAVRFKGVGQLDDGLRREPARRDGGWRAGVPRAHPRLQRAARSSWRSATRSPWSPAASTSCRLPRRRDRALGPRVGGQDATLRS